MTLEDGVQGQRLSACRRVQELANGMDPREIRQALQRINAFIEREQLRSAKG